MRTARTTAKLVIGVAASLALARDAGAQSAQRFSMQISGLYASLFGQAYEGFGGGMGFEGQLRYTTQLGWSFGAGYQRTQHDIEGISEKASLSGPFFEPRYTIELTQFVNLAPYVSGRLSVLKESLSERGFEGTASGFTLNGGGGVLVRLGPRVNLDLGATFGYTSFGDAKIFDTVTGQTTTVPNGNGSNVVLRTGLAIGLF